MPADTSLIATDKSPKKRGGFRTFVKKATLWTIGSVFVVGLIYGSGMRATQRMYKDKLEASREAEQNATRDLRLARLDLTAHDALMQQWEARRQMHLAVLALDQRNFGTAQEQVSRASTLLERAQKSGSVNIADFAALTPRVRAVGLVAAADIGTQREQLLSLLRDMDRGLDAALPKSVIVESVPAGTTPEATAPPDAPPPAEGGAATGTAL